MKVVLLEGLGVSDQVIEGHARKLEAMGHSFVSYPKNAAPQVQVERSRDADVILLANMPCPQSVDIPGTFAAYNRKYQEGTFQGFRDYMMCTMIRNNSSAASNCIRCGKCEKHCPQHIAIRDELQNAQRELEGPLYRGLRKIISWVVKF